MNAMRRRLFCAALTAAIIGGADAALGQETALANGVFLVAKPDMPDPRFRETVVLITQPEIGGGPLGVIVNQPIAARLSEIVPDTMQVPERYDQLYGGGPVERNRVLFLVRAQQRPQRSLQVLEDVYLSGDPELLGSIMRGEMTVAAFRAYAGYSGWAPGQLQAEIARGGWYVIKADADTVFAADASAIWPALIKRIGTHNTRFTPRDPNIRALRARGQLFASLFPANE